MPDSDSPSDTAPPAAEGGRLKLKDVRNLFRLVEEVRELGNDPQKWRPHMCRRIKALVGANVVVSSEVHFRRVPKSSAMKVIDVGWVCDADGNVSQIHTERDDERPEAFWLVARNKAGAEPEAPAKEADEESNGDANDDEVVAIKPAKKVYGGTTFILSQINLPHIGAVDQLGLHREWGEGPFTRAQHRLVRVFHTELARLWKRDVLRKAQDATSDLPPRLAQTLEALLEGASEKQIAQQLNLSRHTIHNYVKALHQRFEVSSRGELLAKAGQIRSDTGPKLSVAAPRKTKKDAEKRKRNDE